MYMNKEFMDNCGRHRLYDSKTSYFNSEAFRHLDRRCNNRIGAAQNPDDPFTSVWQLGGDGVELMTFGIQKASVLGLRCEYLPPHLSHTTVAPRLLIIVEGPKEKSNLDGILTATLDTFIRHAPVTVEGLASITCIERISCAGLPVLPL
jgi:hypothetical protein